MIARTNTTLPAPIGTAFEFEIPRPVASSKNRRRLFARGTRLTKKGKFVPRIVSLLSEDAEDDTALIRRLAGKSAGDVMPFGPDDALRIDYSHCVETDRVTVRVEKVGTLPARGKRGTRRDVFGMLETIADALQGVLYPDDRQVDAGSFARRRS